MKYKVGDRVRIKSIDWYNENKGNADKTNSVWCEDGGAWFFYHMSQYCGKIMTIENVWSHSYTLEGSDSRWTDEMIECLVEEETKFGTTSNPIELKSDANSLTQSEVDVIEKAKTFWDGIKDAWICPEGYIFKDENGNIINATKIVLEKKKKEYPKTYEECFKIIGIKLSDCYIQGYKSPLLEDLQELLICRDAYWKIAGEEIGLGKLWNPDWLDDDTKKYVITSSKIFETFGGLGYINYILTFPTKEMRDAFYENFKELIEQCKELF